MLLVLFSVIEIGRAMFVLNALSESTRRAARMAAVCPINDPAITEVGLFNAPGEGTGTRIGRAGLSTANFASSISTPTARSSQTLPRTSGRSNS